MGSIAKITNNILFYIGPNGASLNERRLNHMISIASAIIFIVCALKIFATLRRRLSVLSTLPLAILGMVSIDIFMLTRFKAIIHTILPTYGVTIYRGLHQLLGNHPFVDRTFFIRHFVYFIDNSLKKVL